MPGATRGETARRCAPAPRRLVAIAAVAALLTAGCAGGYLPRIDPTGQSIFLPPNAAVAEAPLVVQGPQVVPGLPLSQPEITIAPGEVVAPVGSEVIVVAGVACRPGQLLQQTRIEWMLSPEGAGQFVSQGPLSRSFGLPGTERGKVDNQYAIGFTSPSCVTINRGTASPADDVVVRPGQAWVTVTSPTEGTSRVTAFGPAVPGWDRRLATSTIHWIDAQWVLPPPAVNPLGANHVFTTTVTRRSDGSPLAGYAVRYEVLGGASAGFAPDGSPAIEVATNELGQASAEIVQQAGQPGTAQVGVQIIRPALPGSRDARRLILGSGTTSKTWTSPQLAIRTTGPARATRGATLTYRVDVTNPGDLLAGDLVVSGQVPAGLSYLASRPEGEMSGGRLAWRLGELPPRETRSIEIDFRADREGPIEQCVSVRGAGGLTAQDCASTLVDSTAPQLGVQLLGPPSAAVGSTVRYEVVVSNRGNAPATGLTITDRFDEGLEHPVSASPIERDLEDIAAGSSQSIYVTFRVTRAGQLCHTVEVEGEGLAPASARACLEATGADVVPPTVPGDAGTLPPAGDVALQVRKSGPRQAQLGDTVEFFLEVTNTGDVPLTGVRIADAYDLAFDPINATDGFTVGREELVWTFPRLAPGETQRLQVNCQCKSAVAQACNRVVVTCDQQRAPIADEACLSILAPGQTPDVPVTPPRVAPPRVTPPADVPPPAAGAALKMSIADLADPIASRETTRYRVVVQNTSNGSDKDVQLTLTLPEGMTPVDFGTRGPARYTIDGQTIRFEPVAELRAGETVEYVVPVRADRAGSYEVRADLVSENLDRGLWVTERTEALGAR